MNYENIKKIPIHFSLEGWFHYLFTRKVISEENLNNFIFIPIGAFFRNYSSEIYGVYSDEDAENAHPSRDIIGLFHQKLIEVNSRAKDSEIKSNNIYILINRDGLYDKLPYFLFHKFNILAEDGGRIESEREEQLLATAKLLPIDNVLIKQKTLLLNELRKSLTPCSPEHFKSIFHWKLLSIEEQYCLSPYQIPENFFRLLKIKNSLLQYPERFELGLKMVFREFILSIQDNDNSREKRQIAGDIDVYVDVVTINRIEYTYRILEHNEYVNQVSSLTGQNIFTDDLKQLPLNECRLGINAYCGVPFPDELFSEISFKLSQRELIRYFLGNRYLADNQSREKIDSLVTMYFDFFAPLSERLLYPLKFEVTDNLPATLSESIENPFSNILGFGITIAEL